MVSSEDRGRRGRRLGQRGSLTGSGAANYPIDRWPAVSAHALWPTTNTNDGRDRTRDRRSPLRTRPPLRDRQPPQRRDRGPERCMDWHRLIGHHLPRSPRITRSARAAQQPRRRGCRYSTAQDGHADALQPSDRPQLLPRADRAGRGRREVTKHRIADQGRTVRRG